MWWLATAWLAADVFRTATPNPPLDALIAQYVSDALGVTAAILLLVSWGPAVADGRVLRARALPVLMLGAAGFSQVSNALFLATDWRHYHIQSLAVALDDFMIGIASAFVALALTCYGMTLRTRALGGSLILGWVTAAAAFPLAYMSNWPIDTAAERCYSISGLILLAIVVMLTVVYVRKTPNADPATSQELGAGLAIPPEADNSLIV
jgi:hypothetical protein